MKSKASARRGGFTLIEILAVMAIIGILAALSLGVARLASAKSERAKAVATLNELRTAVDEYRLANGAVFSYVGDITAMKLEWRQALTNFNRNLTDADFRDPWGRSFFYSNRSAFVYALFSHGPNTNDPMDDVDPGRGQQ